MIRGKTSKGPIKPKPLIWMGDSLARLQDFPEDVQDEMGFALFQAQTGEKHPKAKPLTGLGGGILKLYRIIAAIRFAQSTRCV